MRVYTYIYIFFFIAVSADERRLGDEGGVVIKRFLREAVTGSPIFTDQGGVEATPLPEERKAISRGVVEDDRKRSRGL